MNNKSQAYAERSVRIASENQQRIDYIKSHGWRVFVRPSKHPTDMMYCFYTDGTHIGYAQWTDYRTCISSVHYPNRQSGTGFQIADEITKETLHVAAHTACPNWARNDQSSVKKYKDWDAYHNASDFNKGLVEV